jgi:uncharacterized protein (DUF58 family)
MKAAEFTLGTRQIYIVPTRPGLLFALVLFALLLAAINYANALAYLLTFFLASLAIVSFLHTQRNLLDLRITATGCDPVFVGDAAVFHLCVRNGSAARIGLRVETGDLRTPSFDVPAADTQRVALQVPALRRGWLDCPPLELVTRYPLGIARAWTRRMELAARCLVYPKPAAAADVSAVVRVAGEGSSAVVREGEDFAGLRAYQAGDALARLSWKTQARGQGVYTKEFGAPATESVWLDWDAFPAPDTETRISLLTRALLDAEDAGLRYGLTLPGCSFEPANGATHRARCLEALAVYEDRA